MSSTDSVGCDHCKGVNALHGPDLCDPLAERARALEEAATMLEGWIEYDNFAKDECSADALSVAVSCIRALKDRDLKEPCGCEGCPAMVEAWSRSGMCGPCAHEDCEHEETET